VKNQNLGLEVPYLRTGQRRKYLPDFIVRIDDGQPEPLNLIVEIKGYRGEDAKEKANTPHGVWSLQSLPLNGSMRGRWY
jgi:type III restriction enzyme